MEEPSDFDLLATEELQSVCEQMGNQQLNSFARTYRRASKVCQEIIDERKEEEIKKLIVNTITSGDRIEAWRNKDQIASITIDSKKRSGNIRIKDKSVNHPLLLEGFSG